MPDTLHTQVIAAIRAAAPVDYDSALEAAKIALAATPTELFQFTRWFQDNGDMLVKIINSGRG